MIYYAGLFFKWVGQAVFPTLVLMVGGALGVAALWWLVLRPRRRPALRAWLGLCAVVLAFGCWRTAIVWHDFSHPEVRMFREFIAKPIPREIKGLAPAIAAPVMFHDGAYISFHAPRAVVERIVNHSLPGSKALAVVEEMKRRSQRNTTDELAVVGPDGESYRKVDLEWAAKESAPEYRWIRDEVEKFLKNRDGEVYVLARGGAWGKFVSILQYEGPTSKVVILQHLERRR